MQYVLHITKKCNFSCGYCFLQHEDVFMDKSIAFKIADVVLANALSEGKSDACISFYGGEPLLYKEIIFDTVEYCRRISEDTQVNFSFMLTTNGWFADDNFLQYAKDNNMKLSFSIDGIEKSHNRYRHTISGEPTFERVYSNCKRALTLLPDSSAMSTFNPSTLEFLFESVEFLYDSGFKTIIITPNLCTTWSEDDLSLLQKQYEKLAIWYGDLLLREKMLKLPIFDNKIVSWLTSRLVKDRCIPGKNRISIDVYGNISPCIEYSYFAEYKTGEVAKDLFFMDEKKMRSLADKMMKGMNECEKCALEFRCDNKCGCINLISSGNVNKVSPLWCAHERILTPIADKLGERIFVD